MLCWYVWSGYRCRWSLWMFTQSFAYAVSLLDIWYLYLIFASSHRSLLLIIFSIVHCLYDTHRATNNQQMNRREPKNNYMNLPLNTLMDVKNTWNKHPLTCIKVSLADIIQFAAFFVTTRQKETPKSLTLGSVSSNAKRAALKNDFVCGSSRWSQEQREVLSQLSVLCTGAGGEIKTKKMDRNGFTAGMTTRYKSKMLLLLQYDGSSISIRNLFLMQNWKHWR